MKNKLPASYFLTKEQVFKLAKKYIDENDIDGFNKQFMFMTPQMFNQLLSAQREQMIERIESFIKDAREDLQSGSNKANRINSDFDNGVEATIDDLEDVLQAIKEE